MPFDPFTQDILDDPDDPPGMRELIFHSGGAALNGVVYHPSGAGPHPLILLLHGLPGHERNFDLAQILRRAGYVVAVFHYRGAWGSEGAYRFSHVLEDVQAALAYFREGAVAHEQRVDRERIAVIGHSLGGWAALMAAADGLVETAASIAGVNIGLWGDQLRESPTLVRPMLTSLLESSQGPLSGANPDAIIAEIETHADRWNPVKRVRDLAARQLLLVAAKRDAIVPVFDHHMPLVQALRAEDATRVQDVLLGGDHVFSSSRLALARALLAWLGIP